MIHVASQKLSKFTENFTIELEPGRSHFSYFWFFFIFFYNFL